MNSWTASFPQIGRNDEVIVSDDGSLDDTVGEVRGRNDPRIRVIANQRRVGYVGNFQRAINAARGSLIFFSDQDDVWLPGKVATLRGALRTKALAATDAIVVNERLEKLHESYFVLRGATRFDWQNIYVKPSIIGATVSCRRDYLLSLLPFPPGIPHDLWLSINAAWDRELAIIQQPFILYRRHSAAHSPTATERKRGLATIAEERLRVATMMVTRRLWRGAAWNGAPRNLLAAASKISRTDGVMRARRASLASRSTPAPGKDKKSRQHQPTTKSLQGSISRYQVNRAAPAQTPDPRP